MEKFKKEELKKKIIFIGLTIPIAMIIIGVSYAFFNASVEKEEEKITIISGDLALTFRDNDENIENIDNTWNLGDSVEKELVIENTGTRDAYAKISWDKLINSYLAESLSYTLEEKSDEPNAIWKQVETENVNVPRSETASTQLLVDHLLIPAGRTYTYKVKITFDNLEDIDQTPDVNAKFITKFMLDQGTKKLTTEDKLANLNIKISKTNPTSFANPATTDETANGLFSLEDDYGISYYYRGTAPNNYIKFGQNADGRDMWWRIIRFNGDGSVRMQYDGTGASGTNTYTRGFAKKGEIWNISADDTKYVGWMFGGEEGIASTSKEEAQRNETNTRIKAKVDEWYKTNIVDTGYGDFVADAIFCNDRSIPGKSITKLSHDTELGYGSNLTAYGAFGRFVTGNNGPNWSANTNPRPQFACPQKNDKFTVDDTSRGNGALTYPVGLITADEIVAAGSGKWNTENESYYLNKKNWYWSLSPMIGHFVNHVFVLDTTGSLASAISDNGAPFAPVINLKAEYLDKLQGNGTIDNPYHL